MKNPFSLFHSEPSTCLSAPMKTNNQSLTQNSGSMRRFLTLFQFLAVATLVAVLASTSARAASTWAGGLGNWSSNTSPGWNGTGVPAAGVSADIGSASKTITLDVAGTTGNLSMTGSTNAQTTLTLTGGLTFNNSGSTSVIENTDTSTGSSNRLSIAGGNIILANDLIIRNTGGSTNTSGAITLSSTALITGTGNLTFYNASNSASSGAITLQGTNTFSGSVLVQKGFVAFSYSGGTSFGNSTNAITLGSSGNGDATLVNTSSANTIGNDVSIAAGAGILTLGSTSTVSTADTTYSGPVALNGNVTLTSAKTGTASTVYSGNITASGALTVGGSTLTNTRTTLKGVNTFTGDTRINSGILYIGANSGADSQALAKSTVDLNTSDSGTLNFGTVAFNGTITGITSATFGGLKGSRDLVLTNISASPAAVALTIGNNNTDASYSGGLSGSGGSLIKVGSGTQTLSGTNTYTGATTVNLGTLLVSGSLTSAMTANAGTIGGSGSTTGNVTIGNSAGGSDAFIAPGNGTVGTFTTAGSLSLLSDATFSFELNGSSAAADQLVANGVTINSSAVFSFTLLGDKSGLATQTFKIIDNTSVSNISGVFSNLTAGGIYDAGGGLTFSVSGGGGSYGNDLYLTVATVPEPATWGLLAFSLTTVLVLRRRRS